MKQKIAIDSTRGASVHVYIDTQNIQNHNALVVFVPGLLEVADSFLLVKTAQQFNKAGFTTARIDSPSFYGDNHRLTATSIGAQARDLSRVVSYFRPRFDQVVLVAHSMGAFVTLVSETVADCAILWDPSLHPREIFASVTRDAKSGIYHDPQLQLEVSSILVEELPRLPDIAQAAHVAALPIGIVSAPHGAAHPVDPYVQNLPSLLGHIMIEDADHNFSEPKHRDALVRETIAFIKKAA